jgi:uncharacterized RDD family membrane protein YckC
MNYESPVSAGQNDLLSDVAFEFEYASTGQRFLNYLIDYVVLIFAFVLLIGLLTKSDGYSQEESSPSEAMLYLLLIVMYVSYYTICEVYFKGRTLGKLITGTKAVRNDNQPLTLGNGVLRSLSRIVPFEVLSGFGTPWHDSWTDTMVIKTR